MAGSCVSAMRVSLATPLVALRHLVLRHQPPGHARMTEATYTAKYLRVPSPITDADLAAHLAGDLTLAAVLQGNDGACVAACDIDAGGEAMVREVMRAAELRACHAYGCVLDSGDHQGGHVWIFFDHLHAARDLQTLMRDIVADAQCPTTEIYPNNADLRLPFGLHRRCQRRGTLLLHSAATPLDLDADLPGALAAFLIEVRLTSDLPVRVAQEAQQARRTAVAEAIAAARPRRIAPDAHWREVIAHFNRSTDLVSLLEGYGARAAYYYAGGKTLLHCAASQDHTHGDAHPSLVVEPGRGQQAGRMICGCYCPACRLHNQPGQVMDAFEVFCRLEHISKREGVQRLQNAPSVPQTIHSSGQARPASPVVAERVPVVPRPLPPAERVFQQQLIAITADGRVQPLDRRLLAYVISHGAHGQGIANATLAAALGARPDSIKRAKRRLRELGYIAVTVSTDGVSASAITIVTPVSPDNHANDSDHAEAQGGVQVAPPFHVTELTCVDATPPPVSHASEEMPSMPVVRSEAQLRRRRRVLMNMIRAGVMERRRLAFTAEIAVIDAQLHANALPFPESPVPTTDQDVSDERPAAVCAPDHDRVGLNHIQLAQPDDPHPAMTDAQLSALLVDALSASVSPAFQSLLERVQWRSDGEEVVLVCHARDLAPVTSELLGLARIALMDLNLPSMIRVQIGTPASVARKPAWIGSALWERVPIWMRSLLMGSSIVGGHLYGATSAQTHTLASHCETVHWVLGEMRDVGDDGGRCP